jgi:outer membrane biosynthesis protein TonB
MRPILMSTLLLLIAGASSSARAGETRIRAKQLPSSEVERELILPAGEISAAVEPWVPDVRACWLQHASRRQRVDGNLRIEIVVDPTGIVWHHGIVVAGPRNRRLDRCLARVVAEWRFPMRRGYTQAAIPFVFRASAGRGTGPFPGCFSPRGCPGRRSRPGSQP